MSRAPMNAVKERKECSLARREARTESRIVEDIREKKEVMARAPVDTCSSSSRRPNLSNLGNQRINVFINPVKSGPHNLDLTSGFKYK